MQRNPIKYIIIILSGLLLLLGLVVIIGWYTNNITLIKVLPSLGPMQYNTALGFILVGFSFLCPIFKKFTLVKIMGILIMLLAVLTLCEYIFDLNWGIDELFIDDNTTNMPYPGRMGFNTALCYLFSGLAIINIKNKSIVNGLGSLIFGLGLAAFVGYFIGLENTYNWGGYRHMAIHTAYGFSIAGISLSISSFLNEDFSNYSINRVSDIWFYGYALSFGITIFLIDLSLNAFANVGLLYILLLLLSYFFKNKNAVFILASFSIFLLILGYFISKNIPAQKWIAIANRSTSIFIIIFTTILLYRIKKIHQKQKDAESKLLEFNKNLEDLVAERTRELEISNSHLLAANNELEMFSYSVSHDLKAPLRALQGFSNSLYKKYIDQFDETGSRWLTFIKDNAERMDILIQDILIFSRIGKAEVKHGQINMNELVDELIHQEKQHYKVPIEFNIQKLPITKGDPTMLKMVWQNLIENAFKYSSKKEKIRITISGYENEEYNHYLITDNGVGFDMKYYDKLFGIFQRLHGNDEFEGTGVGLANVKRIIEKHKGEIRAESILNEGSTFEFSLPK